MGMIELTKEIQPTKQRGNKGSALLGLLLLGAGYWTVGQGIVMYHKGLHLAARYIIAHDIAQVGIEESTINGNIAYTTAMQLDSCQDRLSAVAESIGNLPEAAPRK